MNELNEWLEVIAPMVLVAGLIPLIALTAARLMDMLRELFFGLSDSTPVDYKRPVAIEVEQPKLKNEPDDGYGIWITDDEARELGLGYDLRERVQELREE